MPQPSTDKTHDTLPHNIRAHVNRIVPKEDLLIFNNARNIVELMTKKYPIL